MCGSGNPFIDLVAKSAASGKTTNRALGDPLGLEKKALGRLAAPSMDVNLEQAAQKAQAQKLLAAAAFGLSDTKLTGGKGIGSVPPSLLTPKATIGG